MLEVVFPDLDPRLWDIPLDSGTDGSRILTFFPLSPSFDALVRKRDDRLSGSFQTSSTFGH